MTYKFPRGLVASLLLVSGTLLYAQPTEPPAEQKTPQYQYKGTHIAILGAYGMSNPNASFSKFLSGTEPDYRSATEFMGHIAHYWSNESAIVVGIGGSTRNIAFKDNSGKGNFPLQFYDFRGGYRAQRGLLMVEFGLLYAVKTKDVPVTIETASSTITVGIPGVVTKSYAAVYLVLGINYPFTESLYGIVAGKIDYGVTPAVSGDWPLINSTGKQVGSESFSLVPFNMGFSAGLSFRL